MNFKKLVNSLFKGKKTEVHRGLYYDHLVEASSLTSEIDKINLEVEHKNNLKTIIHSTIHHTIINSTLSVIDPEKTKLILQHLINGDNSSVWSVIGDKKDLVEDKITKDFATLKKEVLRDLYEGK